ncbi:MAG: hypothetical protein A2722_00635 [Candidatus Doudnabacteria bacterium RIFCSPHIGHO2_01_FULL_50_11]|uniref:Glycosyltransferase RgtA/B/C/D-like domain-containing protein n=1 Tax=Candidatus Doudnabacteria bacterium RIFCSPHIGHO2_01_FULL_50_11 TaxID=1817828 RepID=A0A1F5PNN5_9BACT|nr:MAG: hypothetical protein A2722_00635 [Candidatus Doudnabacteria bacterium RIFCSPHIGHO2_01_FULL_50_11]
MAFFRRLRGKSISFTEVILLLAFSLAATLLLLGALSVFTRGWIMLDILLLTLAAIWFRPRIAPVGRVGWLFLLVPIVGFGFMLLRGFYVGDAYYHWLPFAREIVRLKTFPDFLNFNWFSVMPLQSLLFAMTFALSGGYNEFVNLWVPFFFTAATALVLLEWGAWEGLSRRYLFFMGVLLFANQGLEWYGSWNLMQEPLVLFFATCAFYYYLRYRASMGRRDMFFALLAFCLTALSKQSGLFLLILLVPLFAVSRDRKAFFIAGALIFLPLAAWLGRNYFVYGNPIFPLFNSFFGGPYAESFARLSEYAHHSFSDYPTLKSRLMFSIREIFEEFPYVLLALWGMFKRRSYAFLAAFLGFFFLKESFLFSSTSDVRYYYPLLGLLIVYGVIALNRTQSKFFLSSLLALSIYQLLGTPAVDSTSAVIARSEDVALFLRPLAGIFHDFRLAWALGLGLFGLFFLEREYLKTALVYSYSLFIIKLKFIANKSWLNAWTSIETIIPFVPAGLSGWWRKRQLQAVAGMLALLVGVNSWGLGMAYVAAQGKLEFPVQYIWSSSVWARSVLDQSTAALPHDSFYIVIFAQRDYFMWYTDYRTVTYSDFDFHELTKTYRKDMTASDLRDLFEKRRIKYIVRNALSNDIDNTDFAAFEHKIADSGQFILVASTPEDYEVWQVY